MITNYIENTSPIFSNKARKPKKHVIKYIHVVDDSGEYIKTQIISHMSWSRKLDYENIDIYSDEKYLGLRTSFEHGDSFFESAQVEIKNYKEKTFRVYRSNTTRVPVHGTIIIDLPEIHYSYNRNDKCYFRMRECKYDPQAFPCSVSWVQIQNRSAHYVDNVDTSSDKFDENSVYVYLNQTKMKEKLYELILEINTAKSKVDSQIKSYGVVSTNLKTNKLNEFITTLFDYSIKLFYINTSYGWKYEDLDYDLIWNLALYILQIVRPFKDGVDWLEGVTTAKVRYLLCKKLFNIKEGVDVYLIKRAKQNSELTHEKTLYAKESTDHDKFVFKMDNPSKKQTEIIERNKLKEEVAKKKKEVLLERNKLIKEMYTQGKSVFLISNKFHISIPMVYKVLKS